MDMGVSGGGVMTGEPSAAVCTDISAQIHRPASAAAAAARCNAVAVGAVLLGSAIEGPGFDSRGSQNAAMDMFSVRFKTNRKKKHYKIDFYNNKKSRDGNIQVLYRCIKPQKAVGLSHGFRILRYEA